MIINLNDSGEMYAAKCRTAYRALRYSPIGVSLTFKHDEGTVAALALVLIPTGGIADVEDGIIEGPVDALLVVAPSHHTAVCTDIEEINGVFKLPHTFQIPGEWRARVALFLQDMVHFAEEGKGDSERG